MLEVLTDRREHVQYKGAGVGDIACGKASAAGSVSQRACVFCGSRVVLYPIADALHIVHGPVGCAVYTWDIRGALSSGPQLHRNSYTTDLREQDIIRGGEKKLYASLTALIERHQPRAAFVYSTCIVGLIGDDVHAVCRKASMAFGIPVIPVMSEGFKGTKKDGYHAACEALFQLIGTGDAADVPSVSINILGEFNLAGETWIIKRYFERMGVHVTATITGDGRVDDIRRAHGARLNVVQCAGSMMHLAEMMEEKYGIPFKRVSYFGIEDMSAALYDVADFFDDQNVSARTSELVRAELKTILPALHEFKARLTGKKAAIYVGGAFKAFSLVRALRLLGIETVMVGSQTGDVEDYRQLKDLCNDGAIIADDSNPVELAGFVREKGVDLFIGGVKERPIAYKLGVGFCDHNHERKIPLAGFEGMLHFAREIYGTVSSPVWSVIRGLPPGGEFLAMGNAGIAFFRSLEKSQEPDGTAPVAERQPISEDNEPLAVTRNACKLCTPLGACLAFRGIENAMSVLHGSQGCATYIRRYLISHFREPMDIASSSFNEYNAVFGGARNLARGLDNVCRQYKPELIGVATTCLSETIGENVAMMIRDYRRSRKSGEALPALVHVSTPSYRGTHVDGFHDTVRAIVEELAVKTECRTNRVLILPGMASPADLRHLKDIVTDFGLPFTLLPDYSDTLDAPLWDNECPLPEGGTPLEEIRQAGDCGVILQLGAVLAGRRAAADVLAERFETSVIKLGLPIGVCASDALFAVLASQSSQPCPVKHVRERGRLLDALSDGHKYVFGKRAVLYGEDDLIVGLAAFLNEIGMEIVLCATGGQSGHLHAVLNETTGGATSATRVMEDADFATIIETAREMAPDILIGNSKGMTAAQALGAPLIRVGFPVHDRFGAQRIRLFGYAGTQQLFDKIVNALLEKKQNSRNGGYAYL